MHIRSSVEAMATSGPVVPVVPFLIPDRPGSLVGRVDRSARKATLIAAALTCVALLVVLAIARWTPASISARPETGVAGSVKTAKAPPRVEPVRLAPLTADQARSTNAEVPFSKAPLVPARAFRFAGSGIERGRATDCLAAAAWYEAGDDPVGERSVAQVVLNRARHPAFPAGICAVVFQGAERAAGCQFTFTCDGSMARRRPNAAAWERARAIARDAIDGTVDKSVGLATHYHTDWVLPYWSSSLDKVAKIGTHIFFRWQGYWGTRAAFAGRTQAGEAVVPRMAILSPLHAEDNMAGEDVASALPAEGPATAKTDFAARAANFPVEAARGTSDLRGSRVVSASEDGRRYLVALNPAADPHVYALTALTLCRGKPVCEVRGWMPDDVPASLSAVGSGDGEALRFRYDRTGGGTERARWNCAQIARPSADQCL